MMKLLLIFTVTMFIYGVLPAQELQEEYQAVVINFINAVKNGNKQKIADKVSYPLKRKYPIADVMNAKELIARYNEIFDEKLVSMIKISKPKKDWSTVGWRGIMLHRGILWLDYEGTLLAVNYQSDIEKMISKQRIGKDKDSLHISLRTFDKPILILETEKFRVRIDDIGNRNYRYASWPIHKEMNNKPDLVITNGKYISEGTGGNHKYEFINYHYKYECYINVLDGRNENIPAQLTVYKNNKPILSQVAKIIKAF